MEDDEGKLLGHALWNRYTLRIDNKTVSTAVLAPLAVAAEHQGQGVGSQLMADGLCLLAKNNIDLLLILGHTNYYPRFGLKTSCFGEVATRVAASVSMSDPEGILRPLKPQDDAFLRELWAEVHVGSYSVVMPDEGFGNWCSRLKDMASAILEIEGNPVAFCRLDLRPHSENPIKYFLAKSKKEAGLLLQHIDKWLLAQGSIKRDTWNIPLCWETAESLFPLGEPLDNPFEAGMAMAMPGPKQLWLDSELEGIRSGKKRPLFMEWGPFYDE